MDEEAKRQYLSSLIRQAEDDRARRQIEKRDGVILTKPMISKMSEIDQRLAPPQKSSVKPLAQQSVAFAFRQARRLGDGLAENSDSTQMLGVLENSFRDQLNELSQMLNACTSRCGAMEQQLQSSVLFRSRVLTCESDIASLKDVVSACPKSNEVELQLSLLQRKCLDSAFQEITKSNIGVYSRCDQVFAAVERRLEETVRQFRSEVSQILNASNTQLSKFEQDCRHAWETSQECMDGLKRFQLQNANSDSQHEMLATEIFSRISSLDDKFSREVSQFASQMQLLQNSQSEMFQNLVSQYSTSVSSANSLVIALSQRLSELEEAQLSAPSSVSVYGHGLLASDFSTSVENDRFEELNDRIRNLERKLSAHEEQSAVVSELQADVYSMKSRVEDLDLQKSTPPNSDSNLELKSIFTSLLAKETEERTSCFEHLSDCLSSLQASIEPVFDSVRVGVDADTQVKLLQSKIKMISKSVRRMEEQAASVIAATPAPVSTLQPSNAPLPRDFTSSPSKLSPAFSMNPQAENILDRCAELKLQCDANNEKIEQTKAEFALELEASKDQFRDGIASASRFFELKASAMLSELQQSTGVFQNAQESSQLKIKNLGSLMKQSEEFLYAHILAAEDKSNQHGRSLSVKLSQDLSVIDQKIEKIISQVSANAADNLHFRTLSDSRISACERQSQKNIHSAVDSVVKVIESTRRDLQSLESKVSQDYQVSLRRSAAFDLLEASFAPVAASVTSMQTSIACISEAQAALAGQSSAASLSFQEMKLECQHALATAKALEDKVASKFQSQFLELGDRMDTIDAQLGSLNSGGQQRLEKRLAVIRDEISGHTSHSNRVFDRIQNEMLEMQDKLSKLSVEIVGSAQRADLSHQSLKETLLPSISSLQALVNSLSFRLSRSLQTVQDNMKMVKDGVNSSVSDLACEVAVFSCLEAVVARVENESTSSSVSLLRQLNVQAAAAAVASVTAVADKMHKLEIDFQTMDSDQIAAADLFSKRLVSVEDSVAAASGQLQGVSSDVEAVQAQSAKQAETVSGLLLKVADFEGVKPAVQADMEQLRRELVQEAQGLAGRVETLQASAELSGQENEAMLLASLVKLQEELDGKIGAVKGEVDMQGKSMIEVLETLAAERKAADDNRKQVQTLLQGVSSDVEAVQAQSAKQAETVSGLLLKVADFEGVKPAVQADMEQLRRELVQEAQGLAGRVETLQASAELSGQENEAMLLASLVKLQEELDGKIGAVKGEVDMQGKSMIEVLETLAAERKAADDNRKQVQTLLQGVSSDVEAVQAQSAKQAETVSGLLLKVADFEGVKPTVQADMEQLKKDIAQNVEGLSRCLGLAQNVETTVSHLSSDFQSRCKIYDAFDVGIKNLDVKVDRLSIASSAAETRIESQSKALGVVEGTVERTEKATEALSKEVERLSVESSATVMSACFVLKEDIHKEIDSKISAVQQDVQVQADALQELLDTVSKQQTITNDFIAEVRAK